MIQKTKQRRKKHGQGWLLFKTHQAYELAKKIYGHDHKSTQQLKQRRAKRIQEILSNGVSEREAISILLGKVL